MNLGRRAFLGKIGAAVAAVAALSVTPADAPAEVPENAPDASLEAPAGLPWRVYATCPECKGVVYSVTLGADPDNQMRDAEAERIRSAGFLAFKVRQAKHFDVGTGLKRGCKRSHVAPEW